MSQLKANTIPLPCAVLALSVAVCLGATSTAQASPVQGNQRADVQQRETLEQLILAIQQAAKELDDKLDSQCLEGERGPICPAVAPVAVMTPSTHRPSAPTHHLREAILNLPPPTA